MNFNNKVAISTGAASGMGLLFAENFASLGGSVLMYDLTKCVAQFGAKYGIRCVCVSPGPVLTREAMAKMKTPLGRAAEPQEIVDLCLFIASDKGQFINGENIMIDGGRNAMGRGWV